ncbi:MAG TPA: DUF3105 domain-containing protein [Solirubrobacter sp.]
MSSRFLTFIAAAVAVAGCGSSAAPEASMAPAAPKLTTCDEVAYTPKNPPHFVHPTQNFYAPDAKDAPAPRDIEHLLLNDNAVVVSYPASATRAIRDRLAEWASQQVAVVVVPDRRQTAPVQAKIATAQLTCDGVDTSQLTAFAAKRGTGTAVQHPDEG